MEQVVLSAAVFWVFLGMGHEVGANPFPGKSL